MNTDTTALLRALAAPFEVDDVKWKPQAVSGARALAIAYTTARAVMDRLDSVLGLGGWQTTYRPAEVGVVCTLRIKLGDEWITHEDFGAFSEQPDDGDKHKSAFSDSLKRAAVHVGVGRYLYRLPQQWVDYDPQKRQFVREPHLPAWAIPQSKAVRAWIDKLAEEPALDSLNQWLEELAELEPEEKRVVWNILQRHAEEHGWQFDRNSKQFATARTRTQ